MNSNSTISPVFSIVPANQDQLPAILHLQKECYQAEAALYNDYTIPPLTQTPESIREDFEKGILFLVALVDGNVIGSVRGFAENDTAYIGRLIVQSNFQNKGIGKALMSEIEFALNACKRYELFTGFKSEKNLAMYGKLGYAEFKRQRINEDLTLVYLEKVTGGWLPVSGKN